MVTRSHILRKAALPLLAGALVLTLAPGFAHPETIESLRGTVEKVKPGVLYLTNVRLPDGNGAGKPVMLVVTKETAYYTGTQQATKEDILPGLRVLVACKPAGTGRQAILIRIVGGQPETGSSPSP